MNFKMKLSVLFWEKSLISGCLLVAMFFSTAHAQDPAMALWELYKQGQFEEVELQGKALLNTGTESSSILLAVGRSLTDLQRQSEAVFFLQRAVASDQNKTWIYAWAQVYVGKCRYHLQEMGLARDAWIAARDCAATEHATNEAIHYLKFFGLAESYDHWAGLETEHFSFYFSPVLIDTDKAVYAQQHELMYDQLVAWFGSPPKHRIRFFVWSDKTEAYLAGMPELGFSMPDGLVTHVCLEQTVGYEMTHIISNHAINPVVKIGLINEGAAVVFDGTGRNWMERAKKAREYQALFSSTFRPVPLSAMALWLDWGSQTTDISYPVAGAFVNMLIQKGSREQFLEAFHDQSPEHFRQVYGDDLAVWIREFDDLLND